MTYIDNSLIWRNELKIYEKGSMRQGLRSIDSRARGVVARLQRGIVAISLSSIEPLC